MGRKGLGRGPRPERVKFEPPRHGDICAIDHIASHLGAVDRVGRRVIHEHLVGARDALEWWVPSLYLPKRLGDRQSHRCRRVRQNELTRRSLLSRSRNGGQEVAPCIEGSPTTLDPHHISEIPPHHDTFRQLLPRIPLEAAHVQRDQVRRAAHLAPSPRLLHTLPAPLQARCALFADPRAAYGGAHPTPRHT